MMLVTEMELAIDFNDFWLIVSVIFQAKVQTIHNFHTTKDKDLLFFLCLEY